MKAEMNHKNWMSYLNKVGFANNRSNIRRVLLMTLCILVMIAAFIPIPVKADTGPKPSVVITFNGLEDETYYATLLSRTESTGPFSVLEDGNTKDSNYVKNSEDYHAYLKFLGYEDADGFFFLQFLQNCTYTHKLSWTYYPPQEFKILLYFPKTDAFVISEESYERYAFDSYFTVDASELEISNVAKAGTIVAIRSYGLTNEILSMIIRILITIAIELLIALLFGFNKKKQITAVLITNIATQTILNILLNVINYKQGGFAFVFNYIWMELLVFILEGFVFSKLLYRYEESSRRKIHPWLYALAANISSFVVGMLIAKWIPGIF